MDILKEVIHEQNKELLERIANDKYNDDRDKEEFMEKYQNSLFFILLKVLLKYVNIKLPFKKITYL